LHGIFAIASWVTDGQKTAQPNRSYSIRFRNRLHSEPLSHVERSSE